MQMRLAALFKASLGCITVAGLAACNASKSDSGAPPPPAPTLVSVGSPNRDEDPSVIRARDGSLYLAWLSDRGSNFDIYISRSADGRAWSAAERVTSLSFGDFYPNLYQDDQGAFHLTWFQWVAPFLGQIRYKRSATGTDWLAQPEEPVTTILGSDDWLPTITQLADGTLLVYFVSGKRNVFSLTNDIYMARKKPGASAWEAAIPVPGINSTTAHDALPFAMRIGSEIVLVWVRYDLTEADFIKNPKSDLYFASSPDGLVFSAPLKINNDSGNVVNILPHIYQKHDDTWWLLWLSTRLGDAKAFELPLAGVGRFPQGLVEVTQLPPGYSHRIARTSTPGRYVGVWVQGPENKQDIYSSVFDR